MSTWKQKSMTPHLHAIAEKYGAKLIDEGRKREYVAVSGLNPELIIRTFAEQGDPSAESEFTEWLARAYLCEHYSIADLPKIRDTLEVFTNVRDRLPENERHIDHFQSLGGLRAAVAPLNVQPTLAQIALAARGESRILAERDDGFRVVVPFTEASAKWWGRGTKWYDAPGGIDPFEREKPLGAPLLITLPDKQKLRMIVNADVISIVHSDLRTVFASEIERDWADLGPIVLWAARTNGMALKCVPEQYRDEQVCTDAVKQNGLALAFVPAALRTPELCITALESDPRAYDAVPLDLRQDIQRPAPRPGLPPLHAETESANAHFLGYVSPRKHAELAEAEKTDIKWIGNPPPGWTPPKPANTKWDLSIFDDLQARLASVSAENNDRAVPRAA